MTTVEYHLTDREAFILRTSEVAGHGAKLGRTPKNMITLRGDAAQLAVFLLDVGTHDLATAVLLAERVRENRYVGGYVFEDAFWPEPVTVSYEDSFGKLRSPDNKRAAEVYPVADSDPTVWRIRVEVIPEVYGWGGGHVLWGYDQPTKEAAIEIALAWTDRAELPTEQRSRIPLPVPPRR